MARMQFPMGKRIRLPLLKDKIEYHFRLKWDAAPHGTDGLTNPFDLDAVAFLLGENGRLADEHRDNLVYYNTRKFSATHRRVSADGSTELDHDEQDGGTETIIVRVERISPKVHRIVLAAAIYRGDELHQFFGMIGNASLEVLRVNPGTGEEALIAQGDLTHDSPTATGLVLGELTRSRTDDEWEFTLVSRSYEHGLAEIGEDFDIEFVP